MNKREKQRQDSAKIIGWATIGFILYLVSYLLYKLASSL
jgi:hypothetical protein